ncbi:BZ3500_MvSof-1268-A1-R1_Chr1-3g02299 [Microbotryum saponariae]|uniref:BZ3500_MvSof-1268-A1-R1_Chr1-3g02299 protein n=1 Tax=Microbotryum saponariae TaxID=289078 RepID=A0A2X0KIQ3_9BASI|nr:BZ3500_MvSof-1268-A1-R1_Chr1-3g02299 [Microbotryum saponariae]SCZ95917.1 BZ3501_MvSof-1269-A2-R1_Chr1-3g01902 [Microbotryum saponariae]
MYTGSLADSVQQEASLAVILLMVTVIAWLLGQAGAGQPPSLAVRVVIIVFLPILVSLGFDFGPVLQRLYPFLVLSFQLHPVLDVLDLNQEP